MLGGWQIYQLRSFVLPAAKLRYKAEWQWFWAECKKWLCHHLDPLVLLFHPWRLAAEWKYICWGLNLNFIFPNCKLPQLADIPLGKVLKLLPYRFSPRIKSNPNLSPNILIGVYTRNMGAWVMKCNFITKIKARRCHKILRITSALTLMNTITITIFSPIQALATSPNQKSPTT